MGWDFFGIPIPKSPGFLKSRSRGFFFSKIPKSRNPRDRDGKFSGSRKNPERISKHINYDIMHSQISQKSRKYPEKSQKIFCIHALMKYALPRKEGAPRSGSEVGVLRLSPLRMRCVHWRSVVFWSSARANFASRR